MIQNPDQNEWFCKLHALPISNICLDDHKCTDRRLCVQCLHENHLQIPKENAPLLGHFQNQLNDKFNLLKKQQPLNISSKIKEFEKKISDIIQRMKIEADQLEQAIQAREKKVFDWKNQLLERKFLDFNLEEQNKIIKIFKSDWIQMNIAYLNEYYSTIKNIEKQISEDIECVISQFSKYQLSKAQTIDSLVIFQTAYVLGIKEGKFYYNLQDGSRIYAGKYICNKKKGIWVEYLGQQSSLPKQRIIPQKNFHFQHHSGIKIPTWQVIDYENDAFKQNENQAVYEDLDLTKKNKIQNQSRVSLEYFFENEAFFNGIFTVVGDYSEETIIETNIIMQQKFHSREARTQDALKNYFYEYNCNNKEWNWKKIGGDLDENNLKTGLWIETHPDYNIDCQVVYTGEYLKGLKYGKWSIFSCSKEIGGGIYNEKGQKEGAWIELHENFNDNCDILYSGCYQQNVKYGLWKTLFKNHGGGNYDDKGVKNGEWIDIDEHFFDEQQVTYSGGYKDGQRIGQWKIFNLNVEIGGGKYNFRGEKIDFWRDFIYSLPANLKSTRELIHSGEYVNGKRIGKWLFFHCDNQIGGGQYDENGLKQGLWIDISKQYDSVPCYGTYKDGLRQGEWVFKSKEIAEGFYDKNGRKNGNWRGDIFYIGEYKHGKRQGRLIRLQKEKVSYNERGQKCGEWIQQYLIDKGFSYKYGNYSNGLKQGTWKIFERSMAYNAGLKEGYWWEEKHITMENNLIYILKYEGEYRNGLRFGKWTTTYLDQIIGGGEYNENGQKTGFWIDVCETYFKNNITYSGKYSNGERIGHWVINRNQTLIKLCKPSDLPIALILN